MRTDAKQLDLGTAYTLVLGQGRSSVPVRDCGKIFCGLGFLGGPLESQPRIQLNLTPSADSREYSPDVLPKFPATSLKTTSPFLPGSVDFECYLGL
jgi:hypothetical protein